MNPTHKTTAPTPPPDAGQQVAAKRFPRRNTRQHTAMAIHRIVRRTAILLLGLASSVAVEVRRSFVIIGAGPAGIQWGKLLEEAGEKDYVILERHAHAGSFFETYPRARKLISANRAYLDAQKSSDFQLRHDWHSLLASEPFAGSGYSEMWYPTAPELLDYLHTVAEPLQIMFNTTVTKTTFRKSDKLHEVETSDGDTWLAEYLILATGMRMRDVPQCLADHANATGLQLFTYESFPNIQNSEQDFCRGKRMAVFGSGNAAFETADLLSPCAGSLRLAYKHKPRFSHLTHYVGDVRISSAGILDRYHLKVLDSVIDLDVRESRAQATRFEAARARASKRRAFQLPPHPEPSECGQYAHFLSSHRIDAAVFAGGFTGEQEGVVSMSNEAQRFPEVGSFWSDPASPQRFYAGNLMHGADYRRSAGGFIHGFRYLIRAQARFLLQQRGGAPWPRAEFSSVAAALAHAAERVQESSGLYQMQDFLADVLLLRADGSVTYLYELPEPWMADAVPELRGAAAVEVKFAIANKEVWTFDLSFDWARAGRNPSQFIHPVVTPRWGGARVDAEECHVGEDVENEWLSRAARADLAFCLQLAAEQARAGQAGEEASALALEARALEEAERAVRTWSAQQRRPPQAPATAAAPPDNLNGPGPRLPVSATVTASAAGSESRRGRGGQRSAELEDLGAASESAPLQAAHEL